MLASRIGFEPSVADGITHAFERWDGKGMPGGKGHDIPIAARIVAACRDVDVFARLGGWAAASEVLDRRRATAYDPQIVDVLIADGADWLAEPSADTLWEAVLAAEPPPAATVPDSRLDDAFAAFADFADLKSPFLHGHSTGVARLAEAAARSSGMADGDVVVVRRAALLHDLGRVGVPNGIWDRTGPLGPGDWEQVRLHPYWSERILARCGALAPVALLAGAHHERLDGTGYHRASPAAALPVSARIIGAADVYDALTHDRPHRPARSPEEAAAVLGDEVTAGRLDRAAVDAVLDAAGHRRARRRTAWPAELTDREVEVLRLVARGGSNKDVAHQLGIRPKTVGSHVEHLYVKLAVSSRAAAALFAMQHDLLDP